MYIQKVYFVIDEKQGVIIAYGKVHDENLIYGKNVPLRIVLWRM